METFGSGVLTGMKFIRTEKLRIKLVPQLDHIAYIVEAVGKTAPNTVDQHIVIAKKRIINTTP